MKISYIELLGERHPMCFSLEAAEEISDEFGDLEDLPKKLDEGSASEKIKVVDKLLTILLRCGREYCEISGTETPPPLPCRPAKVIEVSEVSGVIKEIFKTFKNDSAREIEAKPKNVKPTSDAAV